jgi:hypothetical protein
MRTSPSESPSHPYGFRKKSCWSLGSNSELHSYKSDTHPLDHGVGLIRIAENANYTFYLLLLFLFYITRLDGLGSP